MRDILAVAGLAALLALAACDKPPSSATGAPAAGAPVPTPTLDPPRALSAGLPKRPQPASFTLDYISDAQDPLNRRPAVVKASEPLRLGGFAYDPVAHAPAKGLDVVIDGQMFSTVYGSERPDVAVYTKTPGLHAVGFRTVLPAGAVPTGPHEVSLRVIAADGEAYYGTPPIAFESQ